MRGQDGLRGRTLQRQQAPIIEALDLAFRLERFAQVGFVSVLAGRVDDNRKTIAEVRNHQVVVDAALFVCQQGVALTPPREIGRIRWEH